MTGTYDGLVFTEGQSDEFTLMHDEAVKTDPAYVDLSAGIEYAVAETPVKGFTNTVFDNESGVIPVKDTAEAKFTNTRDEGDLVVGKRVVSDLTADRDVAFTFTVELADETIHGPYGEMTFEDGVTTFTLKKGEPIQYTIQVQPVDGYDVDVNGTDVTASLIHRDPEAWMQMSGTKTWDDGNDARGLRPEEITLRLLRDGELFESQTVSEAEGWSYSFGELPADDGYGHVYGYELREDGAVGYFARVDGMNVTNSLQLRNTLPLANDGADPTAPEGAAPVEPLGVGYEEDRNTGTPLPKFGGYTEAELEEQYSMFGYDTPKAGMLNTGDETPAWPWAFGGAGALALIALALLGRRKKRA